MVSWLLNKIPYREKPLLTSLIIILIIAVLINLSTYVIKEFEYYFRIYDRNDHIQNENSIANDNLVDGNDLGKKWRIDYIITYQNEYNTDQKLLEKTSRDIGGYYLGYRINFTQDIYTYNDTYDLPSILSEIIAGNNVENSQYITKQLSIPVNVRIMDHNASCFERIHEFNPEKKYSACDMVFISNQSIFKYHFAFRDIVSYDTLAELLDEISGIIK